MTLRQSTRPNLTPTTASWPNAKWAVPFVAVAIVVIAAMVIGCAESQSKHDEPVGTIARKPIASSDERPSGEHPYTNLLIHETSPYLLQHAHNPVNWHPWGEEAFQKAKREGKPIFLSVGYSTCYWCHVMEVESFEDEEVAAILNRHFIAIKVDREELPDVDEQYMLATQLVTSRGGWPNSVWLTPDGKPWMAGTYFPKKQFIAVLRQLAGIWENRREEVNRQADALSRAISRIATGTHTETLVELNETLVMQAVSVLKQNFDARQGGFGSAPKFPPHGTLRLLMRQYRDTGDQSLLEPITKTLDAMWLGGMHDHIGGGFHRYSTDARWLLPHFEKMLYDNAQLMRVYTDGYLITQEPRYRQAVEDIFRWVRREMTSPDGAFYSAIDSGEVGKEGDSYVWNVDEVRKVLGPGDAKLFLDAYNMTESGNFTEEASGKQLGTNIPHLVRPIEVIARQRSEDPAAFAERLAAMREKLLIRRQTWPQPHKDDKILTSWNGLMIASLAYAGRQLDEPRYTEAAARAATFILNTMFRDGTLLRTYREGTAKQPGYLDDYAYFTEALIELHLATGEDRWLKRAQQLAATLLDEFQDKRGGGFFFTTDAHQDLLVRSKNLGGGGNMPDANGVAAQVLLRLTALTGEPRYAAAATRALESMAGIVKQNPHGNEHLLLAMADRLRNESGVPAAVTTADAHERVDPVTIQVYASHLHVRPGQRLEIAVAIDIDEGWHLYGENPNANFLIPSSISIKNASGLTAGEVTVPEPHQIVDPVLKQRLNTYTGRVWFRAGVTVAETAEPGPVPLELVVKTQACDESRCLPPQSTTLRLPLRIDPDAAGVARHPEVFQPRVQP